MHWPTDPPLLPVDDAAPALAADKAATAKLQRQMAKVHAQKDAKERAEALERLKQDVAAKVLQREFRAMKDERRKAARTRRRKAPPSRFHWHPR